MAGAAMDSVEVPNRDELPAETASCAFHPPCQDLDPGATDGADNGLEMPNPFPPKADGTVPAEFQDAAPPVKDGTRLPTVGSFGASSETGAPASRDPRHADKSGFAAEAIS